MECKTIFRRCWKYFKDLLNKDFQYKKQKRKGDPNLFKNCLVWFKEKYFPWYMDPYFLFVLASLTYHVDFCKKDPDQEWILWDLIPSVSGWTVKQAREVALTLYDSFYTYSDAKFEDSFRYKSIRVLFTFFFENSPYIRPLMADKKKEPHLLEFYNRCRNE